MQPVKKTSATKNAPKSQKMVLADFAKVQESGTDWNCEQCVPFAKKLKIKMSPQQVQAIDISFDNNDEYEVRFKRGGKVESRVSLTIPPDAGHGLVRQKVELPTPVEADTIVIEASDGDGMYSVGHLILN